MQVDCQSFLDANVSRDWFGLEIGPSHQPRFAKADGFNVEIVDHASADQLRTKYASAGVDTSRIEEVDYVSDGRSLHDVVPRRGEYDFVFSSHVIEHIPDFVSYFKSCEMLLKSGGKAILAVPDKRYCFDAFQNPSTTGEVLQAFHEQRTRHTPAAAFDFGANMAAMDGVQAWPKNGIGLVGFINDMPAAWTHYHDTRHSTEYRDYHGWRFTPSSFRLIIRDLNELGILELKEAAFAVSDIYEFYIILSREGAGPGKSRLELMRDVIREQVESGTQILAPFNEPAAVVEPEPEPELVVIANENAEPEPRKKSLFSFLR